MKRMFQIPFNYVGGKLTDRYNKRNLILIFFFIPKNVDAAINHNSYENREEGNLLQILKGRKILILYTFVCCISITLYNQFNYLLPIQMDEIFLDQGAVFYGMLTSVNGLVVINCTPILTQWTLKWADLDRIILGVFLQIVALCSYYFYQDGIGLYILSMVFFTIGEVLNTLGANPYLSKRVPASHRGRIISLHNICTSTFSSLGNTIVGKIILLYTFREGWIFVFVVGGILMVLFGFFRGMDKKRFGLLYQKRNS